MNNLTEKFQLMQMQKALQDRAGKKIKLRWSTPAEVRRSLAKVNNMVANGAIQPKAANSIYYSANLILKALEMEQSKIKHDAKGEQS